MDSDSDDADMDAFGKKKKKKPFVSNGSQSIKNGSSKRGTIAAGTGLKAAHSLNNGNLRAASMGSGNVTPSQAQLLLKGQQKPNTNNITRKQPTATTSST